MFLRQIFNCLIDNYLIVHSYISGPRNFNSVQYNESVFFKTAHYLQCFFVKKYVAFVCISLTEFIRRLVRFC